MGRAERLAGRPRPALRGGGADARRRHLRRGRPRRRLPARVRGGDRRRGDPRQDPRRRVPGRGGRDRQGSVLRRRRPRSHRLPALRALHGRLPARRQEHARQELLVVRRARGREGDGGAHRDGHQAARRAGRLARLRSHHRTLRRLGTPRRTDHHRQGRGRRRGRARHQPPARRVPPERLAPAPLAPSRRAGAHQLGGDPRRHAAARLAGRDPPRGDHRLDLPRPQHPHRDRRLRRRGQRACGACSRC